MDFMQRKIEQLAKNVVRQNAKEEIQKAIKTDSYIHTLGCEVNFSYDMDYDMLDFTMDALVSLNEYKIVGTLSEFGSVIILSIVEVRTGKTVYEY
jgi:hypothetical protein